MQLAIILVLSIGGGALYFIAALACGKIASRRSKTHCRSCSTHGYCSDSETHEIFSVGAGILWPLYILGRISTYIANYDKIQTAKKERRHQDELKLVRQEAELAEARKQAAHEAEINDRKRQTEKEAAMQDFLLEQSGRGAAERVINRIS